VHRRETLDQRIAKKSTKHQNKSQPSSANDAKAAALAMRGCDLFTI
jgi:hypothetical protein